MQTKFKVLAELGDKLEKTTSRNSMIAIVAEFLNNLSTDEIEPATAMILGRSLPRGAFKTLELNWATISGIIKRLVNVDWKDFTKVFNKTGDLGATIKSIFEKSKIRMQVTLVQNPLTILEVRRVLEKIAETSGMGSRKRKERLIETLLGKSTPIEAKYIVKILTGEMRTGFNEGLMELAVSEAFNVSHELVNKANMITGDIGEIAMVAKTRGQKGLSKLRVQVFRPIKPTLAQKADNVQEALTQHGGKTAFEYKLDGARVQIHISKYSIRIFSRRKTDVTDSFPEIVKQVRTQIRANVAILEGEIIAIGESGSPVPFQYLMRRFRRVRRIEDMVEKIPVQLQFFDIVYLDGKSLLDCPYFERRKKLRKTSGKIPLVKQRIFGSQSEAINFLDEALDIGHEGLMAKKIDSFYTPGIRGKNWFKIKRSLDPLDLVIVAAEYGYGRRHKWLSDYYLAGRDLENGKFLVVGKTFKGLNDNEIIEMTRRLKKLAVREESRKVTVIPRIVVEVEYNEIQESPKYRCGMSLRFARITRIRYDKNPDEADTIHRIRKIFEKQFKKSSRFSKV